MLTFIAQADMENGLTIPDLDYMLSFFFTALDEAREAPIMGTERLP